MIRAVIFDVGGVLAHDVFEHLFFDPVVGLADRLNVDSHAVMRVAMALWDTYAYQPSPPTQTCAEREYEHWQQFAAALRLPQPPTYFIDLTDQFVQPIVGMYDLVRDLHTTGIDLLICSNNTEFFFQRQMAKAGVTQFFTQPQNIILSCRSGAAKADPSLKLFRDVQQVLPCVPQESLFIDDRPENVERAGRLGMPAILFPGGASFGAAYLRILFAHLQLLPQEHAMV